MKKITFLLLISILWSCNTDESNDPDNPTNDPIAGAKNEVTSIMSDIYYWADQVRAVDSKPFTEVQPYFDALLVEKDRWSWMMTGEEFLDSEQGVSTSFGMQIKQPINYFDDYAIKVSMVYPKSPLADKGVTRGWTLTHLGGVAVNDLVKNNKFNEALSRPTVDFTFLDLKNKSVAFTASQREISTRSVLVEQVYTAAEFPGLPHSVAYMNYTTFNANMLSDIDNAMARFKAAGVKDMILDLRYNGGGDSRASELLCNYLAPASADGKLVAKREHNKKYSSWNDDPQTSTFIKRKAESLDLDRLFVIATDGSASASEVVINGLRPLMNVTLVGTKTYGKPNGMYVLTYPVDNYTTPEFVFLPICFYSVNSQGVGNYEDGLTPDQLRADDLYHDFGQDEDLIKSCLTKIATGTFPALPPKMALTKGAPRVRISTEVDQPGYGRMTVRMPGGLTSRDL